MLFLGVGIASMLFCGVGIASMLFLGVGIVLCDQLDLLMTAYDQRLIFSLLLLLSLLFLCLSIYVGKPLHVQQ